MYRCIRDAALESGEAGLNIFAILSSSNPGATAVDDEAVLSVLKRALECMSQTEGIDIPKTIVANWTKKIEGILGITGSHGYRQCGCKSSAPPAAAPVHYGGFHQTHTYHQCGAMSSRKEFVTPKFF
eukprot:tig00021339_g20387.t1